MASQEQLQQYLGQYLDIGPAVERCDLLSFVTGLIWTNKREMGKCGIELFVFLGAIGPFYPSYRWMYILTTFGVRFQTFFYNKHNFFMT